jgi:hypothetical protein
MSYTQNKSIFMKNAKFINFFIIANEKINIKKAANLVNS